MPPNEKQAEDSLLTRTSGLGFNVVRDFDIVRLGLTRIVGMSVDVAVLDVDLIAVCMEDTIGVHKQNCE